MSCHLSEILEHRIDPEPELPDAHPLHTHIKKEIVTMITVLVARKRGTTEHTYFVSTYKSIGINSNKTSVVGGGAERVRPRLLPSHGKVSYF
jgi:hypothetical protein